MSFPRDREDLDRLDDAEAEEALTTLLDKITDYFTTRYGDPRDNLEELMNVLAHGDMDDVWGTEGWRHTFLGED